jgi:hypothetical protein
MSDPNPNLRPAEHDRIIAIPNGLFDLTSPANPYPQANELKRQVGIVRPPPIAKQPRPKPIGFHTRKKRQRVKVHGAVIIGAISSPQPSTNVVAALHAFHAPLSGG